jgi:uncharacterized protein YndB with AHSA1/START domain
MSEIRIVKEYPYSPAKVWQVLTEPALIARWLMRLEGFRAQVGTRFRLVAKPEPGWRGFVECEIIELQPPRVLAYTWNGDDKGAPTTVRYTLEPVATGKRLIFEHTGFSGVGGFLLAKLVLGPGWKKMMHTRLGELLGALRDDGTLDANAALAPRFGEAVDTA